MNRRIAIATMVVAAALSAGPAVFAQPAAFATGTRAVPKEKSISFSMRNDSKTAVTIQAGDKQMIIEAGKTVAMKLDNGTRLVAMTATSNIAEGGVITVVSDALANATVVLK